MKTTNGEPVLSAFADGRIRPVADNPWFLLFSSFVFIRVDSWLSTKTKTPSRKRPAGRFENSYENCSIMEG